ncbi:MAG TPA: hypothetical protein PK646_00700 [Bacillota bacterium]|jgi:hypothetical protein|nr:hypothetical protein [Fastidiosipila sp.]HPX92708.1 hypothetical protein [Bacillota bacterium]HQB80605.1 hypothetical protein [Bacillota bacterium]
MNHLAFSALRVRSFAGICTYMNKKGFFASVSMIGRLNAGKKTVSGKVMPFFDGLMPEVGARSSKTDRRMRDGG